MAFIRNYIMERFLERIPLSQYRDKLVLKGGLLVASMAGIDNRATMDMDTTVKNYNLSPEDAKKMAGEIIAIPIEDGIAFRLESMEEIMDGSGLAEQWSIYQRKYEYAAPYDWESVMKKTNCYLCKR